MSRAAVPSYLGNDFGQASPGLRFGMFLPIWTEGASPFELEKTGKRQAVKAAAASLREHCPAMQAWAQRQAALAAPLLAQGLLLELHAQAVAPFATGLGIEHPTENGFAFLWPYGLPYLPASGVKGVLRQAARECGWPPAEIVALFGSEPPERGDADPGDAALQRGALSFWDVLPQIKGETLRVELMTPHQTHYLQPAAGGGHGGQSKNAGSNSPHDSGQPNPIFFLSVPPGSSFVFRVACDPGRLTPELRDNGRWCERLRQTFEHAFEWLGFGAKTTVGYGAMRADAQAQQRAEHAAAAAAAQAHRATLSPGQRALEAYNEQMGERAQALKGRKTAVGQPEYQTAQALAQAASSPDWTPEEKAAAADAIEHWAERLIQIERKDLRKKLGLAALRAQT